MSTCPSSESHWSCFECFEKAKAKCSCSCILVHCFSKMFLPLLDHRLQYSFNTTQYCLMSTSSACLFFPVGGPARPPFTIFRPHKTSFSSFGSCVPIVSLHLLFVSAQNTSPTLSLAFSSEFSTVSHFLRMAPNFLLNPRPGHSPFSPCPYMDSLPCQ